MRRLIWSFIFGIAAFLLLLLNISPKRENAEKEKEPAVIKYLDLIDLIEQKQGNIRIVLQTTDYEGIYHEKVELSFDGQELILDENSTDAYLRIVPKERGITIRSIHRTQGMPTYLGILEIYKEEQGFVIVNELSMEEYLCSVVPSEMPSSYPAEALKAQAVCARTYASHFLANEGYPQYHAHMDDSVMFQVYNNIATTPEAIAAVEATSGQLLCDEAGNLIMTYYYSTGHSEFEREEPFYEWEYEVEELNAQSFRDRLKKTTDAPVDFSYVAGLEIVSGGGDSAASELLVETDGGTWRVYGEYNIRTVLCNGIADAQKQDGTAYYCKTLLPSGYIELECLTEGGRVTGYHICGSGFGHGNGMSQNGAKNMARQGRVMEEILEYYYPQSTIRLLSEQEI